MEPTWISDCGTVKLWLGDCLEVMQGWPDGVVDAVVTSPPYLDARDYNGRGGQWKDVAPPAVVLMTQKATHALVNLGLIHRGGKVLRYWDAIFEHVEPTGWYVWDKLWGLPGDWPNRLAPSHEFVFHFGSGKVRKTVKSKHAGKRISGSMRGKDGTTAQLSGNGKMQCDNKVADSVIRIPRWNVQRDEPCGNHPAPFPIPFAEDLIDPFTKTDDVVADPFMGSGTTGVAAVRLGRQFWGIEIDPEYFETAKRRIQDELRRFEFLEPNRPNPKQAELFNV